jgi:hypothetical protein
MENLDCSEDGGGGREERRVSAADFLGHDLHDLPLQISQWEKEHECFSGTPWDRLRDGERRASGQQTVVQLLRPSDKDESREEHRLRAHSLRQWDSRSNHASGLLKSTHRGPRTGLGIIDGVFGAPIRKAWVRTQLWLCAKEMLLRTR